MIKILIIETQLNEKRVRIKYSLSQTQYILFKGGKQIPIGYYHSENLICFVNPFSCCQSSEVTSGNYACKRFECFRKFPYSQVTRVTCTREYTLTCGLERSHDMQWGWGSRKWKNIFHFKIYSENGQSVKSLQGSSWTFGLPTLHYYLLLLRYRGQRSSNIHIKVDSELKFQYFYTLLVVKIEPLYSHYPICIFSF